MTSLLHISASSQAASSVSRQLGHLTVDRLRSNYPDLTICRRDLTSPYPPHPDAAFVEASLRAQSERDADDEKALTLSERFIAELAAAKMIVIDFPMYNFTLPSCLKA